MKFLEDIFSLKIVPNPIFLKIGFVKIYWYGIFMASAVMSILFLALRDWKKLKKDENIIYDGSIFVLPFAVLGARIYHVFTAFSYYFPNNNFSKENFLSAINITNGGIGIFGAFIGGVFGLFLYSKIKKISFLEILNFIFPFIPLGQAIGRWGNFFNQELFGYPTDFFLKIYIAPENRPAKFINEPYFHPLFFYESLFSFLLFLFLFKKREFLRSKNLAIPIYLMFYGIWRFFIEYARVAYTPSFFWFRLEQWVSLLMIIFGFFWIMFFLKNFKIQNHKI